MQLYSLRYLQAPAFLFLHVGSTKKAKDYKTSCKCGLGKLTLPIPSINIHMYTLSTAGYSYAHMYVCYKMVDFQIWSYLDI